MRSRQGAGSRVNAYRTVLPNWVRTAPSADMGRAFEPFTATSDSATHRPSVPLMLSGLILGALLCIGCQSYDCPRGALMVDGDDRAAYQDQLERAGEHLQQRRWDDAVEAYFALRQRVTEAGDGTCQVKRWYRSAESEDALGFYMLIANDFIIQSGVRQALAHLHNGDWAAAARALDGTDAALGDSYQEARDRVEGLRDPDRFARGRLEYAQFYDGRKRFDLLRGYVRYRVFGEQALFATTLKQLLSRYQRDTVGPDNESVTTVDMESFRSVYGLWLTGEMDDAQRDAVLEPLAPMFAAIDSLSAGLPITRRVAEAETARPRLRHGVVPWELVESPRRWAMRDPEEAADVAHPPRPLESTDAVSPYQYILDPAQQAVLRDIAAEFANIFAAWVGSDQRAYRLEFMISDALQRKYYRDDAAAQQAAAYWQAFNVVASMREWQRRGELATAMGDSAVKWDYFFPYFPHWQDVDRAIRAVVANLHAPAGGQAELLTGLELLRQRMRLEQRRASWATLQSVMAQIGGVSGWIDHAARVARFLGQLEPYVGMQVAAAVVLLQASQPAKAEEVLGVLDAALAQWPEQSAHVAVWRPRIALLRRQLQFLSGGDRAALTAAWKGMKELTPRQLRAELRRVVDREIVSDAALGLLGDFGADMADELPAPPAEAPPVPTPALPLPAEALPGPQE
ncbi:MAG: hypothetical protein HY696_01830 [Deltaproteobacteria bacterium]|nr:hypothetical protein [Deltaproteobacteria bacterium]